MRLPWRRGCGTASSTEGAGVWSVLRGVYSVVPREVGMLLSARELELVLFGAPDIDVNMAPVHRV